MEFVLGAILLGVATGWLAQSKGRNFFGWWLLGTLLPIIGLIMALTVSKVESNIDRRGLASGTRKACPFCAELIRDEARVCHYCGRDVDLPSEASVNDVVIRHVDADTLASLKASEMQGNHR